ncbi:hypothetical protein CBR_g22064 [Chara braunii]|uniref:Protein disulfide-isomerase n=1 Tax=Chara braunii TaxID=69332 RepID=A0A388L1W7_CHABU|nr:hypothetical protein CBR_g22064 [Chara braunii]|eukprot:GBG76316.1 hypothetical protein CBR_g22064 [Chara braunii]
MRRSRSFVFLLLLAVFVGIQLSSRLAASEEAAGGAVVNDDWEVEEGDDVYVGDGEEDAGAPAGEIDESDVLVLTPDNFDDALKNNDYILVEFYAPWCGHCKELKPEYAKAATILKSDPTPAVLAKVDADAHKDLAKQYAISGFPTLLWFEKGKKKDFKGEREVDAIVKWVRGRLGPATVRVNTVEDAADFVKANAQFVAGYFATFDGEAFDAFESVAKDDDGQKFAATTSSEVAALLQIPAKKSSPAVVLVKPEEEQLAVFDGSFVNSDDLAKFVLAHKMPLVTPFTSKYSQRIFSCGISRLLLLFVTKEDAEKLTPIYSEVAKTVKGDVLCITVDLEDESVANVRNFFAITTKEAQIFGYRAFGDVGEQYRFDEGPQLTEESMKRFAQRFAADKVPISYKSEDIPEKNDDPVKVVVGKSIDQIVLDDSKDVLLEMYMTNCPHCQKLAPIYFNLAKRFSEVSSIVIAKINGELNDHPLIRAEVYPTVRLFPAGKKNESIEFKGDKNLAELTRFLKANAAVPFTLERKPVEAAAAEEQVIAQKTDDEDAAVQKDEL